MIVVRQKQSSTTNIAQIPLFVKLSRKLSVAFLNTSPGANGRFTLLDTKILIIPKTENTPAAEAAGAIKSEEL